ncbi:MAG: peptide chain release factor N(5)-glutamine methyltransferase [bacterium]
MRRESADRKPVARRPRDLLRRTRGISRADAEFLLLALLGCSRHELWLDDRPVAPSRAARFARLARRVAAGEPPQYVTGRAPFLDFEVRVDRRVLVPRPETEELVLRALERRPDPRRVLDFGTGSGCIAIAVARLCPRCRVLAVDSSRRALALAGRNVGEHRLGPRVRLAAADRLDAPALARRRFDLIIANPPYVPTARLARLAWRVRDHEPRAALDGGPDGARILTMLIDGGPDRLAPGGLLALEIDGSHAGALRRRAPAARVERDLAGRVRYLFLEHPGAGR